LSGDGTAARSTLCPLILRTASSPLWPLAHRWMKTPGVLPPLVPYLLSVRQVLLDPAQQVLQRLPAIKTNRRVTSTVHPLRDGLVRRASADCTCRCRDGAATAEGRPASAAQVTRLRARQRDPLLDH
jgi:hypothetical protein